MVSLQKKGEDITANNIGVGGIGWFKQKNGEVLEFKNINVGSSKISLTDDTVNNEIDIDVVTGQLDHGELIGLSDDDHAQYLLLVGRSGGQIAHGGTGAGENLTLSSTSHATKGKIIAEHGMSVQCTETGAKSFFEWYNITDYVRAWMYLDSLNSYLGFSFDGVEDIVKIKKSREVVINGDLSINNELRFYDVGTSNYVGFEAPALSADQIWVLPNADGNANEVLKTDGSGSLGWVVTGSGDLKADGTVPLTANWDVGAFGVRALTFESDVTTGTAPLTIASTTVISHLNADLVDGLHAADVATANKLLALNASKDMVLGTGDIEATDARLKKLEVNQTAAADIEDIQDNGTVVRKIHDGGIMDLPKQSGCRVRLTNDQTIPTATWTKMALATEDWDIQNEFDSTTNYRFTATKAGKYHVNLQGFIDTLADTNNYSVAIKKNGAFSSCFATNNVSATLSASVTGGDIVELAIGDYISAWIVHWHGSDRTLSADIWNNYLSIVKVA